MNRKQRSPRNGYVLIMCLFVLALAGIVLAMVARRSLSSVLQANAQAKELSDRWLTYSLSRAVLSDPNKILYEPNSHRANWELSLSDRVVVVELSDESAKLNVNMAKALQNGEKWQSRLTHEVKTALLEREKVSSWAQVFGHNWRDIPMESTTCWSNGPTNIRNASDQTIRLICDVLNAPEFKFVPKEDSRCE